MMTRGERLMATLQGEGVDRPAVNFYEIGGFDIDPDDPDEFNVYHDPSWRPLLQLAEEHSDLIRMRSPVRSRSYDPKVSSERPSAAGRLDGVRQVQEYVEDGCRCTRVTLRVGGRTGGLRQRRGHASGVRWRVLPRSPRGRWRRPEHADPCAWQFADPMTAGFAWLFLQQPLRIRKFIG